MQFLADAQALCIAMSAGDILLLHLDTSDASLPHIESVGIIDSGIRAMAWSPDTELVLFVTGTGTLLEMSKDFDVISEIPIQVDDQGQAVQVSVGWGKKETQFHGSAGKQAALQHLQPVQSSASSLSPDDSLSPQLSWRGDGNFFACSTVDVDTDMKPKNRVIRVYNRESVLQNTSEFVSQLEHSLSWRPSGNLIASTQRLPHRHDVVFFERNGLRHGEFTLRDSKDVVVELQWNSDSSALAILLSRDQAQGHTSAIQIWSSNNYYWYLKQELRPADGQVSFSSKSAATLLVDHSVHFWDKLDQPSASIVHLGSIQLPKAHAVRQIAWVDEHTLLSLEHDASHGTDRLVAYSFDLSASPPGISKSIDIPHPDRHAKFIRLYHNATSGIIALQTSVGKVFQVSNYDGEWYILQKLTLPAVCPWMASAQLGATDSDKE
eukprot:jgi/Hompol1/4834/HPOL_003925-RA